MARCYVVLLALVVVPGLGAFRSLGTSMDGAIAGTANASTSYAVGSTGSIAKQAGAIAVLADFFATPVRVAPGAIDFVFELDLPLHSERITEFVRGGEVTSEALLDPRNYLAFGDGHWLTDSSFPAAYRSTRSTLEGRPDYLKEIGQALRVTDLHGGGSFRSSSEMGIDGFLHAAGGKKTPVSLKDYSGHEYVLRKGLLENIRKIRENGNTDATIFVSVPRMRSGDILAEVGMALFMEVIGAARKDKAVSEIVFDAVDGPVRISTKRPASIALPSSVQGTGPLLRGSFENIPEPLVNERFAYDHQLTHWRMNGTSREFYTSTSRHGDPLAELYIATANADESVWPTAHPPIPLGYANLQFNATDVRRALEVSP